MEVGPRHTDDVITAGVQKADEAAVERASIILKASE